MKTRKAASLALACSIGLLVTLTAGPDLAAVKKDVAVPLLGHCPGALWSLLTLQGGQAAVGDITHCGLGGIVALAIPGRVGLFLLAYRRQ